MADLMAGVFAARGDQGLVVHGLDGLDELTTTSSSTVWVYADGVVRQTELDPLELGIPRAALADLVGGDPLSNASVVREMVGGRAGPIRDVVLLNAAAALVAYAKPPADGSAGCVRRAVGPGPRGGRLGCGRGQAGGMGAGDPGRRLRV